MRTEARSRTEVVWASFDALSGAQLLWLDRSSADLEREDSIDDEGERDALVRRVVRTALTAKQREVVEAHFFVGLSQGEIARKLGISQQVVHKRLYGVDVAGRRVGGAIRKLALALSETPGIAPRKARSDDP
jgi:DNA-directed RNA polymerase specialized sigma24 family protein